jgi:hypothetical protein
VLATTHYDGFALFNSEETKYRNISPHRNHSPGCLSKCGVLLGIQYRVLFIDVLLKWKCFVQDRDDMRVP